MIKGTWRAGHGAFWGILFFLWISAAGVWAELGADLDDDCDVDGKDVYLLLSDQDFIPGTMVPGLALEFGEFRECCNAAGSGDPVNGYPKWQERTVMVFTNMARMAPMEYRDRYMDGFPMPAEGILNPDRFPAVAPVYWHYDLNRAARYHAGDMATNCGLQHDSCDGTGTFTRILSFYTGGYPLSENVAYGYKAPWQVVSAFLCDRQGLACALDTAQWNDIGHRINIMNGALREMGAGHARGEAMSPGRLLDYWVQDFGGGIPADISPVVAASHEFYVEGVTSFYLNYFDPSQGAPVEVSVYVDDTQYLMALDTGQAQAGTYRKDLAKASGCRSYHFMVKTQNGQCYRYPETAYFHTYKEGGCLLD